MVAVDLHRGSHRTSSRSPLRGAGFSKACELASNTRTIDATFSAKVNGVLCQLRITAAVVSERFVIGYASRLNLADDDGVIASRINVHNAAFNVGKRTL